MTFAIQYNCEKRQLLVHKCVSYEMLTRLYRVQGRDASKHTNNLSKKCLLVHFRSVIETEQVGDFLVYSVYTSRSQAGRQQNEHT